MHSNKCSRFRTQTALSERYRQETRCLCYSHLVNREVALWSYKYKCILASNNTISQMTLRQEVGLIIAMANKLMDRLLGKRLRIVLAHSLDESMETAFE